MSRSARALIQKLQNFEETHWEEVIDDHFADTIQAGEQMDRQIRLLETELRVLRRQLSRPEAPGQHIPVETLHDQCAFAGDCSENGSNP